jgi:hypothetical protein
MWFSLEYWFGPYDPDRPKRITDRIEYARELLRYGVPTIWGTRRAVTFNCNASTYAAQCEGNQAFTNSGLHGIIHLCGGFFEASEEEQPFLLLHELMHNVRFNNPLEDNEWQYLTDLEVADCGGTCYKPAAARTLVLLQKYLEAESNVDNYVSWMAARWTAFSEGEICGQEWVFGPPVQGYGECWPEQGIYYCNNCSEWEGGSVCVTWWEQEICLFGSCNQYSCAKIDDEPPFCSPKGG